MLNIKNYKFSFIVSIGLHFVLLFLLLSNFLFVQPSKNHSINKQQHKSSKPIKAVSVDKSIVDKEIARLNKVDADKKAKEQQRQIKLQKELAKMKKQRQLEAKKVADAKRLANKLKKEQAELKRQQAKINQDNKRLKQELANKRLLKQKVERELKQQLVKKQQQELLEKLKQEQQQVLEQSLAKEDELINSTRLKRSIIQKEIERYSVLQQAKVSRNWIARDGFLGKSLITKLAIRLAPDGRVLSVKVVKASGDISLDNSAKNAIFKASPLPVPKDHDILKNFSEYTFTFRPDELT